MVDGNEVKISKDERNIVLKDDVYVMTLNQVQEYDKKTIDNMVKEWKEGLKKYGEWLEEFEEKKVEAIKLMAEKLEEQKQGRLQEVSKTKEEVLKELEEQYLKDKKEQLKWLDEFEKHLEEGKRAMSDELERQKQAVLDKIDFFKRGLKLWEPVVK